MLPVSNVPETARICRISHIALAPGQQPELRDSSRGGPTQTVVGEDRIRAHLGLLNREVPIYQSYQP